MGHRRQLWNFLNTDLRVLEEGKHYFKDELKPPIEEKMLHKNPDPEESDNEKSKMALAGMGLLSATKRDIYVDLRNPRQKLTEYTKGEDEILPFDHGPVSQLTEFDMLARQQVNLVIQARNAWGVEDTKYDVNLDSRSQMNQAQQSKAPQNTQVPKSDYDPPPTPAMRRELARASLMESTQSL
jgi:hypothetical protein